MEPLSVSPFVRSAGPSPAKTNKEAFTASLTTARGNVALSRTAATSTHDQNVMPHTPSTATPNPPPTITNAAPSMEKNHAVTRLPTPVVLSALKRMLGNHEDANYFLSGFESGFCLGFNGIMTNIRSHNSASAKENPDQVFEKVNNEIKLGRIAGPFPSPPFDPFICTPLALREKSTKGKFRLQHNLSYPYNNSAVNLNIPDSAASVSFDSPDRAFELLLPRPSCYLSKSDIADAFRLIPLHPSQYPLTGFSINGNYYYDKTLPMGARSACRIFETFSSALQDILVSRYYVQLTVKVPDDFFFIGDTKQDCLFALECFRSLLQQHWCSTSQTQNPPPHHEIDLLSNRPGHG